MQNPFQILEEQLAHLTELVNSLTEELKGQQTIDQKPLNVNEASKYLDIAKPTLYALTSKRKIPHMKVGKKLYFDKAELDSWLKTYRKKTEDDINNSEA
ncbi:MAG: helix-turn-helix domain-containing protein [bacterium]